MNPDVPLVVLYGLDLIVAALKCDINLPRIENAFFLVFVVLEIARFCVKPIWDASTYGLLVVYLSLRRSLDYQCTLPEEVSNLLTVMLIKAMLLLLYWSHRFEVATAVEAR